MSRPLGDSELRAALATDMFRDMPAKRLGQLLKDARVHDHPADMLLFVQGDDAAACYIVLEGWVKLFRSTVGGDEAVIGVLTAHQSFAEAPALVGGIFPVSAQAVTPVRVIRIPADSLRRTMLAEPEICMAMLASTLRHLRLLVAEIEHLKAQTGAQRVAEFLVSLAACESGAAWVALPYDKTLIAGRLGIKPESLSRAFQKLRDHGVRVEHAHVSIADIDRLRAFSVEERSIGKTIGHCGRLTDRCAYAQRSDSAPEASSGGQSIGSAP